MTATNNVEMDEVFGTRHVNENGMSLFCLLTDTLDLGMSDLVPWADIE